MNQELWHHRLRSELPASATVFQLLGHTFTPEVLCVSQLQTSRSYCLPKTAAPGGAQAAPPAGLARSIRGYKLRTQTVSALQAASLLKGGASTTGSTQITNSGPNS